MSTEYAFTQASEPFTGHPWLRSYLGSGSTSRIAAISP